MDARVSIGVLVVLGASLGCGRIDFDPRSPELQRTITRIVVGGRTSCLRGLASVSCWGLGAGGRLGDGDVTDHADPLPRPVIGVGRLEELDVNDGGALGRTSTGEVQGWGANEFGNLASGMTGPQGTAVPMLDVTQAIAVTMAYDGACIVDASHHVACAGARARLGDGSATDRGSLGPVPIEDVVEVSGGDSQVCARHLDGSVSCWGGNSSGQLGDGTFLDHAVAAPGPRGPYRSIAVGDHFGCGLVPTGEVECWGENTNGQLGDGTQDNAATPVRVGGVADVTALAVGASTACALHRDRTVSCWGSNQTGELAIDVATLFRPTAERIGLVDVLEISARTSVHFCAITGDLSVWCWGENLFGQLGVPPSPPSPTPVRVDVVVE